MPRRLGTGAAILALLSGCTAAGLDPPTDLRGAKWDVDAVAALPLNEDPFQAALQEGYIRLARAELAEFDWIDGAVFAAKAKAAAEGAAPEPFDPQRRVPDGPGAEALAKAATRIAGFRAREGALLRAGRQIGELQVHFDCWVQEAEEGHQNPDIKACREQYELTLILARDLAALPKDIAVVLPEEQGGPAGGIQLAQGGRTVELDEPFAAAGTGEKLGSVPVTQKEIREAFADALGARPPPPVEFPFTFDFNSARISDDGFLQIAKAAEEALSREAAEVIITGYADAPGTSSRNLALSRQRAAAVRREVLRELGRMEGTADWKNVALTVSARGERDLAVETPGRERRNRRVVILVR